MLNPIARLENIEAAIAEGKTISINNPYRITRITPKTYNKFVAAGIKLFITSDDHLLMRAGKRYESINFCTITVS